VKALISDHENGNIGGKPGDFRARCHATSVTWLGPAPSPPSPYTLHHLQIQRFLSKNTLLTRFISTWTQSILYSRLLKNPMNSPTQTRWLPGDRQRLSNTLRKATPRLDPSIDSIGTVRPFVRCGCGNSGGRSNRPESKRWLQRRLASPDHPASLWQPPSRSETGFSAT
jgi:hypothetical protein